VPIAIVDSHVHFWDPRLHRVPWIEGKAVLERRYAPADYRADTADAPIDAIVCVEANVEPAHAVLEVSWLATLAREDARIAAIVAWAPVDSRHHFARHLDRLMQHSALVKGVRRNIQGEADPRFCVEPGWLDNVQLVGSRGLSFDVCATHDQLPGVIEMVQRCPQTSFVLDHLGKPAVRDRLHDPWRANLRALGALPNVVCKLSGLVTEADHANWTIDDLALYVATAIESFGEDRLLFGSDWPVVRTAGGWQRWAETLDRLTHRMGEVAMRKLWRENARRVYRIGA
jgi:L-fuconolactonase